MLGAGNRAGLGRAVGGGGGWGGGGVAPTLFCLDGLSAPDLGSPRYPYRALSRICFYFKNFRSYSPLKFKFEALVRTVAV